MKRKLIYAFLLVAAFLSIAAGISTWTLMEDTLTSSDLIGITDVSDTTQSASGTSKRLTFGSLLTWMQSSLSFQGILSEGAFVDGDKTKLDAQSGTNTGDQDISGIAINATAIAGKEDTLGNPASDGYVLSSTAAGVRSWIVNGSGSMTYPGAGIPVSTGSAWGTSYSLASLATAGGYLTDGSTFAVNLQTDNNNLLWTTGTTFLAYLQTVFEGIDTTILRDADIDVEVPAYSHFANQTAFEAEFFTLPTGGSGCTVGSAVPARNDSGSDGNCIWYAGTMYQYDTDHWETAWSSTDDLTTYYTLTVTDPGNNNVISSSDSDLSTAIDCGDGATDCTAQVASGATLTGHTGTAASGYEFTAWTGADTSSENPATTGFTMTGNLTLGATFGASSGTPQDGDIANEGFEGTGTELTWTGSGGDVDATWGGSAITGGLSDAAEFSGTSAVSRVTDLGTLYDDIWVRFKFYLGAESLANYESAGIFWLDDDGASATQTDTSAAVYLQQDGAGDVHIYLWSENGTVDGGVVTVGSTYSISLLAGNRWSGAANLQFSVGSGDTYGTLSDSGQLMGGSQVRYAHIGMVEAPSAAVTFQIDVLQFDDDGTFDGN